MKCVIASFTIIQNCQTFHIVHPELAQKLLTISIDHSWSKNKLNEIKFYLIIYWRESLIPNIELDEETFYYRQNELLEFFNTKVNKSAKLSQRFKEFFGGENDNAFFCGVIILKNVNFLNLNLFWFKFKDFNDFIYNETIKHYSPKRDAISKPDACLSSANKMINYEIVLLAFSFMLKFLF